MSDIVQKLWGFCHTMRHDGIDYGDYIEQLTFLLFLKMADERAAKVPKDCDWASLKDLSGTTLTDHYADILRKLRETGGLLADIFAQATPRFNNPVNLKRVIAMIDEEDWSAMDVDVKGAAFEGLLEKAASEGKKGAGQYFTPRPLTAQHLAEFADCYGKDPNGLSKRKDLGETGRLRKFHISEIKERGYKLDVTWLKDDSLEDADELPEPQDLAAEAITELEAVVDDLREIVALVEKEEGVEK